MDRACHINKIAACSSARQYMIPDTPIGAVRGNQAQADGHPLCQLQGFTEAWNANPPFRINASTPKSHIGNLATVSSRSNCAGASGAKTFAGIARILFECRRGGVEVGLLQRCACTLRATLPASDRHISNEGATPRGAARLTVC